MHDVSGGLVPLSEMKGWRVADGYPDVRGWSVYVERDRVGTVRDLVVDPRTLDVRFLVVGLKHALLEKERRATVPIGRAHLGHDDVVYLDAIDASELDTLREYDAEQIRALGNADFAHPDYDQARFWGERPRVGERWFVEEREKEKV
ncbi:MAG: PRC-barrel domain-containing protein [Myxococcota bacterium]